MKQKFDFMVLLDDFFDNYLEKEIHVTPMTKLSYADSLGIFVTYMENTTGKKAEDFKPGDFQRETVVDFLNYLEQERGNCIRTRNARLACLRSFFSHLYIHKALDIPAFAKIAAIQSKKHTLREVEYLFPEEIRMILNCIDRKTDEGQREYLLFVLLIQTGMRVSELCKAKYSDILGNEEPCLEIHGKGRKERLVRLTVELHHLLMEIHATNPCQQYLFPNYAGRQMTRHGICFILNKIAARARKLHPQLEGRQFSPHILRHTNAMLLLWAKNDIVTISRWLGHSSVKTTEIYLHADCRTIDNALQCCSFLNLERKIKTIPTPVREKLNAIKQRCRSLSREDRC